MISINRYIYIYIIYKGFFEYLYSMLAIITLYYNTTHDLHIYTIKIYLY